MEETILLFIFLGVYILAQVYILPKMGISTWMRNSCQVADKKTKKIKKQDKKTDK